MHGIRTLQSLGAALRAERESQRMTQRELAEKAAMSRATVIALESGARIDATTLLAAAKALDLEISLTPRRSRRSDVPEPSRGERFDMSILEGTEEL